MKSTFTMKNESTPSVRPVIGITGNYDAPNCLLGEAYYKSVLRAGGTPVIIPPFQLADNPHDGTVEAYLASYLDTVDGLIFSGGADLNPLLLGEQPVPQLHGINTERDAQELLLMRLAYERQIPILGICRGIQVMAAALGGTVVQDIYSQGASQTALLKHSQEASRDTRSHTVDIVSGSVLHTIYGVNTLAVNSFHHQAVATPPPGFTVSAQSPDGIVEAMESTDHKSVLGVQWHPECFDYPLKNFGSAAESSVVRTTADVFDWIVGEAASFHRAKSLHQRIVTVDSHCDTPTRLIRNTFDDFFDRPMLSQQAALEQHFDDFNTQFAQGDSRLQVDLPKMTEGGLDASFMVAYLRQGERDEQSLRDATARADYILTLVEQLAAKNADRMGIARTADDIYRLKAEGRRALVLGIENGYAIGRDLTNVQHFRQRGVAYMTLCHNGDNDLCDSNKGCAEHGGISAFGEQVVKEMNRVGMMIDLSHAADSTFDDVLRLSSQPVVCSHSSSRALCPHPRNLTDEQMRRLAQAGGVAQVTIYGGFLRAVESEATVDDIVAHLNHMVRVMGVEHVGIGTDFDGGGGVPGCNNAAELINFTRRLLAQRYSDADMRLLWGENFLRVMRQVQGEK